MKKKRIFFRSFYLTLTVLICFIIGIYGIGKAYENTVNTAYGKEKSALAFEDGKIKILDFTITLPEFITLKSAL